MSESNNTVDPKAVGWTVGIHLVILLIFFFISYNVPATQPVVEMGMEVNIGTSADGYGTMQPLVAGEPAPSNAVATTSSSTPNSSLPDNILESDDPDAPIVNQTNNNSTTNRNDNRRRNNNNNNRNNNTTTNNNSTPQQKARYVYDGGQGTGGNGSPVDADGSSEGDTKGNRDRGVPGGTPGAGNYEGTPGSGISHTLGGRSIVAFPDRDAEFREGGKVVVHVTVNKLGVITNSRIKSASSAGLKKIALEKVKKIRFNKSENVPEEQFGEITFVFKTRS
ncbi:MAG: energy transducer TonB [Flavipsychrobacter sp.]